MKYDPALIEKKWQRLWEEKKVFKSLEDPQKPKYYVLDMFPYPSGSGLHVGHTIGYTATDVVARYKRSQGFSVLHPMGWDSFGLPAEQYAIRTGTHPRITTQNNITCFRKQLKALGYGYDWDREIVTSDPSYYKWTQWIFTKLYERGLAYRQELLVNYCPALGTVLANEEIEEGKAKEGGHPIERRPLKQWVLKITDYAERLLEDLEDVDWPEGLKKLQRNWIGRSEGGWVDFSFGEEKLRVFTTRLDTLFGVTFLAISPEHPLLEKMAINKEQVLHYQREISQKSDLERTELNKEKTGVFTGAYAHHPVSDEKIPIWVADYVLMHYGSGVVMGVPAHDSRDFAFAKKYALPIKKVVLPPEGEKEAGACWEEEGVCIHSQGQDLSLEGLSSQEAQKRVGLWLEKKEKGKRAVHYRLRDWLFSRQRYWGEPFPILYFKDGSMRPLELDELPLIPPEIADYKPSPEGLSPLAACVDWVAIEDKKSGKQAKRETDTMPQWAGSCWYYLRFCDPANTQKAWGEDKERYWMPVDLYVGGAEHAVLHLLYARFWHKVLYDCGLVKTKEPFRKLYNQGLVVSPAFQRGCGTYIPESEVVKREGSYYHWETGEELKMHIEKMSKSKLNGISPDLLIEEFGADALRLYSLFMGPLEKEKIWHTENIAGCRRFLNRFYEMVTSEKVSEKTSAEAMRALCLLEKGVREDLEKMLFNTAISKMMEFVNAMVKLPHYPQKVMRDAVIILAPFAPHMAEELWHYLGGEFTVSHQPWPHIDSQHLVEEEITYIIQINGRVRGTMLLPRGETETNLLALAKKESSIAKHWKGEVKKVIFVPDKLLNIVMA